MAKLRYQRSYDVTINEAQYEAVTLYDENNDTNYAFELVDAATRCCDGGNLKGTLYLQLDDDGSGCYSWFDEKIAGQVLFEVQFDVEEYDADSWEDRD